MEIIVKMHKFYKGSIKFEPKDAQTKKDYF